MRFNAEKIGPYIVGLMLLAIWFALNYSVLLGQTPYTAVAVKPAVPPEIVGRILGYSDSACLMFLAWLYQSSRTSSTKDETINKLAEKSP